MKYLILILFIMIMGCVPRPVSHYHIYIDPNCSSEVTEDILSARDQWEQSTPVKLEITQDICPTDPPEDSGCFRVGSVDGLGQTWVHPLNNSSHTIILETLQDPTLAQSILHEMGHVIGLMHVENQNALMHTTYRCDSTVCNDIITSDDVQQYFDVRK